MINLDYIRRENPMFDIHSAMYENLLCKIYGYSDKTSRHGATHEIYDGMLRDIGRNAKGEYYDPFEAGISLGEIKTFITEALDYASLQYEDDSVILSKLHECKGYLQDSTLKGIETCLDKAYKILM